MKAAEQTILSWLARATRVASATGGFDLPSAAIGAATGASLVMVLLAAGVVARRRPLTRRHGAIGA